MPVVRINMFEGRPIELKRALVAKVTEAVADTLSLDKKAVTIIITEDKKDNYATDGILAIDRPAK